MEKCTGFFSPPLPTLKQAGCHKSDIKEDSTRPGELDDEHKPRSAYHNNSNSTANRKQRPTTRALGPLPSQGGAGVKLAPVGEAPCPEPAHVVAHVRAGDDVGNGLPVGRADAEAVGGHARRHREAR